MHIPVGGGGVQRTLAGHAGAALCVACVRARCAYAFSVWAPHATTANRYASRGRRYAPRGSSDDGEMRERVGGGGGGGVALLASGGADGTVRLWRGARAVVIVAHAGPVSCVAFASDGRRLASGGGGDGAVRLWAAGSGDCVRVLMPGGGVCISVRECILFVRAANAPPRPCAFPYAQAAARPCVALRSWAMATGSRLPASTAPCG